MYDLRLRLATEPETLNSLALAAEEKLTEAYALQQNGNNAAAVYLSGYTVEMRLKYAYFRLTGAPAGGDVQSRLVPAERRGKQLIPDIPCDHFHSLRFWIRLIAEERANQNRPLQANIELQFMTRILGLYQNWWVGLRYRPDQVSSREAAAILENVQWVNRFADQLWR